MRGRALSGLIAVLGVLLMAPTVGDTGGCGRTAVELEHDRYANARKLHDCTRCEECGLETARCLRACDPKALPEMRWMLRQSDEICASYVDEVLLGE